MSGVFIIVWLLLSWLMTPTGLLIVFVVVGALALRSWFGGSILIRRFLGNRRKMAKLRATLDVNPHDRDARHELAELLIERDEYDEAVGVDGEEPRRRR